jgi:ATP-dependent exoDNAse (exonuclease V) beta subunit
LGVLVSLEGENQEKAAAYELGRRLNEAQEAAELDRLLYVALTRAEQILMISGYGSRLKNGSLSLKGWLGQLAAITGLSACALDRYDAGGGQAVTFDLTVEETAVFAAFYEPQYRPISPARQSATPSTPPSPPATLHTLLPIFSPSTPEEDHTSQRVWQVVPTAQRPQAPAWLVGTLVHQAIALWRFPGPGFERWVDARARQHGLADEQQLDHAARETARLLARFQDCSLYQEITAAGRRLHELPYSYIHNGRIESGYMDLLYLHNGRWTLVDFKTDEIRDESAVAQFLIDLDYIAQVERYAAAAGQLLGERPRLVICLLNGRKGVIEYLVSVGNG